MKKLSLVLILFAFCWLTAENWQTLNNTNHVYAVAADANSLYFSTWGGVVQISGEGNQNISDMQEEKHWTTGDGMVSNDITCLLMSETSQSLWMGSRADGISIVNEAGIQNLNSALGLPSLTINQILEVGSTIYVATTQGLVTFYYLPGINFPLMLDTYNTLNTDNGLSDNNITDIMRSKDNILFLSTASGIDYVHLDSLAVNEAWHSLTAAPGVPTGTNYRMSINEQRIAVAMDKKVYVNDHSLNPENWEELDLHNQDGELYLSDIMLDSENQLWVAYGNWNQTLFYYEKESDLLLSRISPNNVITEFFADSLGLGFNAISSIHELNGDIYLGTWGDGIARFQGGVWETFYPNSIGFPRITHSMAAPDNSLWFCSGNIGAFVVPKGTLGISKYLDGKWENFNIRNSPLHSDNILGMESDVYGRKWFGAWASDFAETSWLPGVAILDESDNSWKRLSTDGIQEHNGVGWDPPIQGSARISTNTIHSIHRDKYSNMLVLCYDAGVSVISPDLEHIADFELKNSTFQRVTHAYHSGRQYFFGTILDNGLSIWNHDSIPVTDGEHWVTQIPGDLRSGSIYGVASTETPYSGWYHFIASGSGLYMWDESNWYRYDTYIKRYKFNFSTSTWQEDTLYYADEERLFGSISTVPNSIYGDPFGRIWIGSYDNGITMYDPDTDRFTSYSQENSPMLSNQIISLGYDPLGGRLLIGTPDGLNTLKIGRTVKPETDLLNVKAFPNPFRPDGSSRVHIVNLPEDSMPKGNNECSIFSSSGALVIKLEENNFGRFEWDGMNKAGKIVSSGIYFFVVSDSDGNVERGKIAIIK